MYKLMKSLEFLLLIGIEKEKKINIIILFIFII